MKAPRSGPRPALVQAGCLAVLGALLSAGCRLTPTGGPSSAPGDPLNAPVVVIPLAPAAPTGTGGARDIYYQGVLAQLQEAARERDLPRLEGLLATHDIPAAPDWAKGILGDFRDRTVGMRLESWATKAGRMQLLEDQGEDQGADGEGPPAGPSLYRLGGTKTIEFKLGGGVEPLPDSLVGTWLPGLDGELDGVEGAATFAITLTLADLDPSGSVREQKGSRVIRLGESTRLEQGLVQQLELDADPGDGVFRTISVVVELLPGQAVREDQVIPYGRATVARQRWTAAPAGAELIRRYPLRALQRCLSTDSAAAPSGLILACRWMPEAQRLDACALLVEQLRNSTGVRARLAMIGLQQLYPDAVPVPDRDAWLAWYTGR